MVHRVSRRIQVLLVIAACCSAQSAWAKTTHEVRSLPGVDGMQQLDFGMLSGDVTLRITTNNHTLKFKVHGKGQVTNLSGRLQVYTDQLALKFPIALTDVHSTYTVQVNGHCTLIITATIVPPCMEPADSDDECVDKNPDGSASSLATRKRAFDAGRRAIPAIRPCLFERPISVDTGIGTLLP
jgi:hypothetical protein